MTRDVSSPEPHAPHEERHTERLPARRLHPVTLLQRVLVSLPALFFLALPLLRNPGENAWISLFAAVVYGVVALPLIVLQYLRFRYWITEQEIVIESGVLTRQHRSIPIERVQNIQVEQRLVPRLFGTAKVKIETAGSSATEGVIEYVSLQEAHRVRQVVRAFQRRQAAAADEGAPPPPVRPSEAAEEEPAAEVLFTMPLGRVLLSGAFRFSLLYIALIFSGLEYVPNFEDRVAGWLEQEQLAWLADAAAAAPWTVVLATVLVAALLGWLTGILINLNKYYNFRLWLEDEKLHKKHGLLTLSEGTIPLEKVQALILRSNPLMRHLGWYRLEVQTMGIDVQERGHQVAVPLARRAEVLALAQHIRPFAPPETFASVSRLTIRRAFVRYAGAWAALVLPASYFWPPALWGLAALPLFLIYAVLRYHNHGYALCEDGFYVRAGVFTHYVWMLPTERQQVFYTTASLFQRRLGLKSLYVDTAGAASFAYPEVVDLPAERAETCLEHLYERFQAFFVARAQGASAPP